MQRVTRCNAQYFSQLALEYWVQILSLVTSVNPTAVCKPVPGKQINQSDTKF